MLSRTIASPIAALALLAAGTTVHAQNEEAASPPAQDKLITEQDREQTLSAELIGANVVHREHGTIGTLDSLLFDSDDQIVGGVVAIGGFLGIGAKQVALSWDEFEVDARESEVYLDLTAEQLEAAPSFKDRATIRAEREAELQRQQMEQQQQQQNGQY